jgi:uncharacterized membrane protein
VKDLRQGGGHFWAAGFENIERAAQVREEVTRLAWERHALELHDSAVAVRYAHGSLTLNGEPCFVVVKVHRGSLGRLLARPGSSGAPPLTGAAVSPCLASVGCAKKTAGIRDGFVRDVEGLIKSGKSVLLVLDEAGNMDAILRNTHGPGGTVLKARGP